MTKEEYLSIQIKKKDIEIEELKNKNEKLIQKCAELRIDNMHMRINEFQLRKVVE